MSALLSHFALRLWVPALALGVVAALGKPLESVSNNGQPPSPPSWPDPAAEQARGIRLQQETDAPRHKMEAAKKTAHQTSAQMRWTLTLPAVGNKRCGSASCGG